MMLDALVMGLDAGTKVARLSHTTISENELLDELVIELGIESHAAGKLGRLREVRAFLDEWTAAGRNAVLVVDEAQNLSLAVLEEIRLLSNLRSHGLCSLQIVLAGQPEFREKLDRPDVRQLRQRISIRYHLTPLSERETAEYVAHRMAIAGATSAVFDNRALGAVHEHSGGVPRMINILCDRALIAGYAAGSGKITRDLVLETVEDVEGGRSEAVAGEGSTGREPRQSEATPGIAETRGRVGEQQSEPQVVLGGPSGSGPVRRAAPPGATAAAAREPPGRPRPAWLVPAVVATVVLCVAVAVLGTRTHWRPWTSLVSGGRSSSAHGADAVAVNEAGPADGAPSDGESGLASDVELPPVSEPVAARQPGVVTGRSEHAAGTTPPQLNPGGEEGAAAREEDKSGSADATTGGEDVTPDAGESDEVPGETSGAARPAQGSSQEAVVPDVAADATPGPTTTARLYRAVALSSRNREAALGETARLQDLGFATEVVQVELGDGDRWYRIAILGGSGTFEEADELVRELKDVGYAGAWVVRE
jgi:type II secretory pathway predicted ATPase ExeA